MFKVWHAPSPGFHAPASFPADFRLVAEVVTPDIEAVFQLTNHIHAAWWDNPEATKLVEGPVRSTSVGDVIEDAGVFWLVKPAGLDRLDPGAILSFDNIWSEI